MNKNINSTLEKTIALANQNFKDNKLQTAINLYNEILKDNPFNRDAHNNLGVALQALGEHKKAITSYEKAIEIDPNFANAYSNLGNALNLLSEFKNAITCYEKAIEINPSFTSAYNDLGQIFKKLKNNEKAKDCFEKSLQLKLNEHPEKALFVYNEMIQRNFFLENNTQKVKIGFNQPPLLTWSLLDFMKNLNLKDIILHELGSGNSTIWFSNMFQEVKSYETNTEWYEKLKPLLSDNVSLKLTSLKDIYDCSINFETTDWLLIDFAGKRSKFIHKLSKLSDNQIPAQIILDNSGWYRNGAKILTDRGYVEIPFHGFKSGKEYIDCSSLFLLKNKFYLKKNSEFYQPTLSLPAFNNEWDALD